jgi:predicted NAD/FAD-dependent oxidoreductase
MGRDIDVGAQWLPASRKQVSKLVQLLRPYGIIDGDAYIETEHRTLQQQRADDSRTTMRPASSALHQKGL